MMGTRLVEGKGWSSKKRRLNEKKHLYVAVDDWKGGYSIHKLDADELLMDDDDQGGISKLPEPAAIRIASPVRGPMAFTALGSNIFVATYPCWRPEHYEPPILVYDTRTSSLAVAPSVRPDWLHDLSSCMAVGEKLYAVTSCHFTTDPSLRAMSWVPDPWDPAMEWSWKTVAAAPLEGWSIKAYALHPDGRTLFMSSGMCTYSLDTSSGVWKDLGEWVLPFAGQAYFDGDLDAWVGMIRGGTHHVCCCPVPSQSAAATQPPECRMLREKIHDEDDGEGSYPTGRHLGATLTYMGDSRFCLVESVLQDAPDAVLRVTLFGLRYDHRGELRTKVRRATRSYAMSKNTLSSLHAAFWM